MSAWRKYIPHRGYSALLCFMPTGELSVKQLQRQSSVTTTEAGSNYESCRAHHFMNQKLILLWAIAFTTGAIGILVWGTLVRL